MRRERSRSLRTFQGGFQTRARVRACTAQRLRRTGLTAEEDTVTPAARQSNPLWPLGPDVSFRALKIGSVEVRTFEIGCGETCTF